MEEEELQFFGGAVTVAVLQAKEILAMDKGKKGQPGTSDPYAKVFVGENKHKEVGRTKEIKKTVTPVWEDESFSFKATPKDKFVVVELFDYDGPLSSGDSLGQCKINLETDFGSGEPVTDWYTLEPAPKKKKAEGSVQLTVTFVPGTPTPEGSLMLKVLQGKDLLAMDKGKKGAAGTSDPFVKVFRESVMDEKPKQHEVGRSKAVKKTLEPVWDDFSCRFQVGKENTEVVVELYDYDGPTSKGDSLGQAVLSIQDFVGESGAPVKKWIDLVAPPEKEKLVPTGQVEVEATFVAWTPLPEGTLTIAVGEAKDIMAADSGGTSDAFARVYLEGRKHAPKTKPVGHTVVQKKAKSPVWNETFSFDTVRTDTDVVVELFDKDSTSETTLGELLLDSLALAKIAGGAAIDGEWFDLVPSAAARKKAASKNQSPDTALGQIKIGLSFDPWTPTTPGVLSLSVVKATDIEGTDKGKKGQPDTSDAYAKVFLHDRAKSGGAKQDMIGRTQTIKKTINPEWNRKMAADVGESHKAVIVEVFDEDRTSSESLGEVAVPFKELLAAEGGVLEQDFELVPAKVGGHGKGTVRLRLEYQEWTATPDGRLLINVVEAKDVVAMDKGKKGVGSSDPYCVTYLEGFAKPPKTNKLGQTNTVKKTLEPKWEERVMEFDTHDGDKSILFELFDDDMGRDESMGRVVVPVKDIIAKSGGAAAESTDWYDIEPVDKGVGEGQLSVNFEWVPWVPPKEGGFTVVVVEAKGLHATDRGGTSDPFALLYVENRDQAKPRQKKVGQTEVVKKTVDPTFEEESSTFSFDVVGTDKTVVVELRDYDGPTSSESLGEVELDLKEFAQGATTEWYDLKQAQGSSNPAAGQVMLMLQYDDADEVEEEPEEPVAVDVKDKLVVLADAECHLKYSRGVGSALREEFEAAMEAVKAAADAELEGPMRELLLLMRSLVACDSAVLVSDAAAAAADSDGTAAGERRTARALAGAVKRVDSEASQRVLKSILQAELGAVAVKAVCEDTLATTSRGLVVHKQKITGSVVKRVDEAAAAVRAAMGQSDMAPKALLALRNALAHDLLFAGLETDHLPPEPVVKEHRAAFAAFQKGGKLAPATLWLALRAAGDYPLASETATLKAAVPAGGYDEAGFLQLMQDRYGSSPDKAAAEAFIKFDADGSGTVDVDELKTLMGKLGMPLDMPDIERMMAAADRSGKGEMSFEDFTRSIIG